MLPKNHRCFLLRSDAMRAMKNTGLSNIQNRKRSASLVAFSRRSPEHPRSRDLARDTIRSRCLEPSRHYERSHVTVGIVPDVFRADCQIGHGGAGVFATALQHAVHT